MEWWWGLQNRSETRTLLLTPQRGRLRQGATSVGGCTSKHVFKSLRSQHGTCCSVWEAARNLWERLINAKNKHPGRFLLRQGYCVVLGCHVPLFSSGLPHQLRTLPVYASQLLVHFRIIAGGCGPSGQLQSCYPGQFVDRVLLLSFNLCLRNSNCGALGCSQEGPAIDLLFPHPTPSTAWKVWAATAPITSLL